MGKGSKRRRKSPRIIPTRIFPLGKFIKHQLEILPNLKNLQNNNSGVVKIWLSSFFQKPAPPPIPLPLILFLPYLSLSLSLFSSPSLARLSFFRIVCLSLSVKKITWESKFLLFHRNANPLFFLSSFPRNLFLWFCSC